MTSIVLVHSPLVGASSWRWVARELSARGHRVIVPSVPGSVTAGGWEAFVEAVAGELPTDAEPYLLAGHSGAGPLLPQISARAPRPPGASVFVDAGIPPEAGPAELVPAAFLDEIRALAVEGRLPKWSEWFGPEVMAGLVPDAGVRAELLADMPELPVSYFESRMQVPEGWTGRGRFGYVLLSAAYAEEAALAGRRGWPVVEVGDSHLEIVTRPAEVAAGILSAAGGP